MANQLREAILQALEDLGGEVTCSSGKAVRKIFNELPAQYQKDYTKVSSEMARLEDDGLVYRDMPALKSTTRVALVKPGVRPGRKNIKVVMEKASRGMAQMLEHELQNAIDAHVAMARAQFEAEQAPECDHEDELAQLRNQVKALKGQLRDAQNAPAALQAQLDQQRTENEELREQLRIANHNVDVWRRQALGKPNVREMLTTVRDTLDPKQRQLLEGLMRELPSSR